MSTRKVTKKKPAKKVAKKRALQATISKSKVIKALQTELLIPGQWITRALAGKSREKNLSEVARYKTNDLCGVCAVGSIMRCAIKDGKLKSSVVPTSLAESYALESLSKRERAKYFDTLIEKKVFLTALSDMFEFECDQHSVEGYEVESAYDTLAELKNYKPIGVTPEEVAERRLEAEKVIADYDKQIKPVIKKIVKFVEKKFPNRIPLRKENGEMKSKALEGTPFTTDGYGDNDY